MTAAGALACQISDLFRGTQPRANACTSILCLEQVLATHAGGGFAKIYAPDGQSIGNQLGETEEGLVVADIDLSLIALAKAVADPAGHYARPDVTRLLLNRSTAAPVEYMSSNFEDVSAAAQEGESDRNAPDDNIE